MLNPDYTILPDQVIPIVVGAHLKAELGDRPRAMRLEQAINQWKEDKGIEESPFPIICTDLWYLNQIELRVQPTISIGHPEVNAATAALSLDLPTALIQDDAFRIQLDPEFIDLKCCLWGVDDFQSNQCLESFINGFLPQLLGSFFGISIEN